jgi:hypothetical protein
MKKIKPREIVIFVVLIAVIAVGSLILYKVSKDKANTYTRSETNIDGTVGSKVDEMINNNAYIEVQVGPQQYVYYVYNKKGEVLVESSGGTQFTKSNHDMLVIGEEEVQSVVGTDPLYEIKYANSLFGSKIETDENNVVNHIITVEGEDSIKELYDNFGEGYGDRVVEVLNAVTEETTIATEETTQSETNEIQSEEESQSQEETADGIVQNTSEPINIQFVVITNDGTSEVFSAYKKVTMASGEEFYDWAFSGYYELGDWELPKEWYGDIDNRPIADMHSDAEKLLKSMDINMLSLMDNLKDIVDGLQTAELKMPDYFKKSSDEQDKLISSAISDLDKCLYVIDTDTSQIKEKLAELKEDEDFNNVSLMLATLYVSDKNGWVAVKDVENTTDSSAVTSDTDSTISTDNDTEDTDTE